MECTYLLFTKCNHVGKMPTIQYNIKVIDVGGGDGSRGGGKKRELITAGTISAVEIIVNKGEGD